MRRVPHRFIEGCLIAARDPGRGRLHLHPGRVLAEYLVLEAAAEEARIAGLFGDVDVVVHRGAGAYICGEESALWSRSRAAGASPAEAAVPARGRPLHATDADQQRPGTRERPAIIELGVDRYKELGVESAPGTVVYSFLGNRHPGSYELPLGATLRELIFEHGHGVAEGRALKAIIPAAPRSRSSRRTSSTSRSTSTRCRPPARSWAPRR